MFRKETLKPDLAFLYEDDSLYEHLNLVEESLLFDVLSSCHPPDAQECWVFLPRGSLRLQTIRSEGLNEVLTQVASLCLNYGYLPSFPHRVHLIYRDNGLAWKSATDSILLYEHVSLIELAEILKRRKLCLK